MTIHPMTTLVAEAIGCIDEDRCQRGRLDAPDYPPCANCLEAADRAIEACEHYRAMMEAAP